MRTPGEEAPELPRPWYVGVGGERRGPLTQDELIRMVTSREVRPETLVWKKGMAEWSRADSVEEIAELLRHHTLGRSAYVAGDLIEGISERVGRTADSFVRAARKAGRTHAGGGADRSLSRSPRRDLVPTENNRGYLVIAAAALLAAFLIYYIGHRSGVATGPFAGLDQMLGGEIFYVASSIIIWVAGALIAVLLRRGELPHATGPALVLSRYHVNRDDPEGVFIDIDGRSAGLVAWFMTFLGIDIRSRMLLTADELRISRSSLFGQFHSSIPLRQIAVLRCGYLKSPLFFSTGVLYLLAALPFLYLGWFPRAFFCLAAAVLLLFGYWASRKLVLIVETGGNRVESLAFHRSIIEFVSVDLEEAVEAMNVVIEQVTRAHQPELAIADERS